MNEWISVLDDRPPEFEDVFVFVRMKDRRDNYYEVAYRNKNKFYKTQQTMLVGDVIFWATPSVPHRKKK